MATVTWKAVLFLLSFVSLLPATLAQSVELTCNASIVYAGVAVDGDLVFAPFPADYVAASEVDYDPGPLGPWYSIAEGIIDVVRPGSVTQGVIVLELGVTLNLSTTSVVENVETSTLLTNVVQWASGIIILMVVGGLIAIGFLVFGCILFVCRVCCKKCGGGLKQKEGEYTNCLTITFTILLILFTCGLIVGVVFAFLTNQQVYDIISEAEETVNATIMDVNGFVDDSVMKYSDIFCTFNETADIGIAKVEDSVDMIIQDISGDVNEVIDEAISLSIGITQALDALEAVQGNVTSLQNMTSALQDSLDSVADDVVALIANCEAAAIPTVDCNGTLDSTGLRTALLANFTNVPSIDIVIANVQAVLFGENENLTALAEQGRETFQNFTANVTAEVQPHVDDIVADINEIRDSVIANYSTVTNISDEVESYLAILQTYPSNYTTFQQVELTSYALSMAICSLAAIVVVVVLLGVLCGILGFRTDRAPYERTSLSNCGAYTLLCSVVLAILFGSLLMILAVFVFFTGSVSYKFCQDLSGPDYVLFAETIDNPDVVGGEYVLSSLVYGNGSIPLTVSGILSNCSDNATVYVALQVDSVIDIDRLTDIAEQYPNLTAEIGNITADQSIIAEDFISSEVRQRLVNFTNSGIAEINITQYQELINAEIVNQSLLQEQLDALQALSAAFNDNGRPDLHADAQNIIMQIMVIKESVSAIESQVSMLAAEVDQVATGAELTVAVEVLLNSTDALVLQINGEFITAGESASLDIMSDFDDFRNYFLTALESEIANCYPLFATYTGIYNTFCEGAVNSLNGLWLALGWSSVFLIPVAILAIITSQFFRRMNFNEDLAIPYDDSFPLKTY